MVKKIHLFSKIFQKRYIELQILEVFLIGAPIKIIYFFPSVSYKGRFLQAPLYLFYLCNHIVDTLALFVRLHLSTEKTCPNLKRPTLVHIRHLKCTNYRKRTLNSHFLPDLSRLHYILKNQKSYSELFGNFVPIARDLIFARLTLTIKF